MNRTRSNGPFETLQDVPGRSTTHYVKEPDMLTRNIREGLVRGVQFRCYAQASGDGKALMSVRTVNVPRFVRFLFVDQHARFESCRRPALLKKHPGRFFSCPVSQIRIQSTLLSACIATLSRCPMARRSCLCPGQLGVRKDGTTPGTIGEQADQAFGNLISLLNAHGLSAPDIVKLTTFIVHGHDGEAVRNARLKHLGEPSPRVYGGLRRSACRSSLVR
jgi:enamine deaminase RidA (YjgF/YER057c/UK114 family)